MLQAFTAWKRRTLLAVGLASAALFLAVASAPAGSAGATSPASTQLQVERLGPKYLLDRRNHQTHSISATTEATLVNEFGPKYLLGYELKAAQK
jgi:predicted transglutaminase-like cysteine proteinase